ncbi:MAG: helix-turn-helix domain-containing protein [Haloferacaceae archaeon]
MTAESTPARILVVEDDHELADLYAAWLDGRHEVATAGYGAEALDLLDETTDVVLLDRKMPGLSGAAVLERIRASDADPQVVMVSAVTPDLDVVQMGFDAYLEKPTDAAALRETVDRMLTRAEYDQKLRELFSLIERQETLEAVKKPEVLEASEAYRSLTDRLETVQAAVESLLADLPDEDFHVAVERIQRTAAERTGERRYESLTEDVLDSATEATVVVDADGSVVWANEATETLLGLDRRDLRGREYAAAAAAQLADVDADEESLASLIQTGLASHGRELEATVHVPGGEERTERWLEYWSAPIETGLYAGGRIEHYHDVTGRHRRERYLQALHGATRDLMAAETTEAVVEQAVRTATSDLEFPYAAVFTREVGTGDLVPAASETTDPDTDPRLPTLSGGSDPVWTAFTGERECITAETWDRAGSGAWLDDAFDDWLLCRLGRQGVFLAAATAERALSSTRRNLAETWAANTRQALEQIARTRNLRDRDRQLEQQNERLSRLDRINRLIRSITPAVVSADTRAEIETEVCRRLLRIDPVTGAWFADVDLPTGGTVCRASAGDLDDYLSDVPRATSETGETRPTRSTPPVPARRAYETRSPVSVTDLVAADSGPWWRDRGLRRGTNAVVAIPVVYESARFGAVEVHLDRPRGISDEAVDALAELGVTIGHGIGAIRQRDALLSGGATTLVFHVGSDPTLSRFATAVDAPLSITDVSRRDDSTCVVIVSLELGPGHDRDRVESQARDSPEASVLRSDTSAVTCALTLGAESSIRRLVRHGAALQHVEVRRGSERLAVTVQLSYDTGVREYVDTVTDALEEAELVAKHHGSVDPQSDLQLATAVDDRLTDRQRQALKMAFHAGYFDFPRRTDARTVAAEIGIAQSTFSQHLRVAEQKLLEELFS